MVHRAPHGAQGAAAPHRSHALSLRSFLLLSVLLPTIGMLILATVSATEARSERRAADRLDDHAAGLVDIIEARAAIADEETASSVVAIAGDLGVGPDELTELYGVDYAAQVRAARSVVDADPVVSTYPELADHLARLQEVRADLDAGRATFEQVHEDLAEVIDELDALWLAHFAQVSRDVESDTLSGEVHARLDGLQSAFHALSDGSDRAVLAIQTVLGGDGEDATRLLAATFRYEAVTELFPDALGPAGATAWQVHVDDPATSRFEATLGDVVGSVLAGEPSPLSDDPVAFGEAFLDGATWGRSLADIVQAAGLDLRDIGTRQADEATRDLQVQVAVAVLLTVLTVAGALALARRVTQPVQRLERAAHEIHAGRFDLEPIEPSGPRELVDTATAFNDMASTLSAVEAHAVALADDPDAPVLSDELPGRTGRALQVALNRVRSSIQVAEQRRRELEKAATHDALTGLLNRAAAFEMIDRDLSRVEREGGSVMALFVDLDGLKPLNDEHGHAVGDDALRRTADALRAATRSSDIVARLGGDEFLVAGVVHDGRSEVDDAAERIRRQVSEQVVVGPGGEIPLRCSIGLAVGDAHVSVETLVNEADAALYEAKRGGRNRVAWHTASEPADR